MKYLLAIALLLFAVSLADADEPVQKTTPVQKGQVVQKDLVPPVVELSPVQKSAVQKSVVQKSVVQKGPVQKAYCCNCCLCQLRAELSTLQERPLRNCCRIIAVRKTIRILARNNAHSDVGCCEG